MIHQKYSNVNVRLEIPFKINSQIMHIDIVCFYQGKKLAFELKYKTRELEVVINKEEFRLKNQSAQDIGRYDFIKDIWRLEQLKKWDTSFECYAIFLTNDCNYWIKPKRQYTVDSDFRIHEGRTLEGVLKWSDRAAAGTKKYREDPINLVGSYKMSWTLFSVFEQIKNQTNQNDIFKYLVIKL